MMEKLSLLFFFLQCTVPAHGMYKRWIKNTNFGDPNNWNAGRAPCGNDVVIIPDESPIVYIQTNTTLKELALPNNGEIIFGRNAILSFTADPSPGCPSSGGDLEYIVAAPRAWTDPSNWCPAPTETGECASPPLLDTEKIPCATDDTVFPRGEAFYVDLGTGLDINVKSLKLSGKSFTTSTFQMYVQTSDGQRIFPPPTGQGSAQSSVSVSRQACTDPTGCTCGNDLGQIYKRICSVYSKTCSRALCKEPFTPVGSCCGVCGAVFNGTVGTGFRIDDFRNILQQFITDKKDNGTVQLIVSKTGQGFIQAVLTGDNGDTSVPVAKAIKADMDEDAQNGGHKYRLTDIQLMESSGAIEPTPPSRHTGSGSIGGGGIAGIVIVLVVVAVVLVVGLLFYRKRTGKSNNMIDDLTDIPNRILGSIPRGRRVPAEIRRPEYEIEMDQGFENPIYGDIGGIEHSPGDVRPMTLMPAEVQPTFDTKDGDSGFNNPLYDTIKQDGTFKDPSSTSVKLKEDSRQTDSDL